MKKPPSKTVWNKEPKKRRKKSPRKKAKDKAWAMCSKYIRLRDCLATTGTKEYGICVTCGGRFPFKKLQAGHGIPGRNDSILCDEELINCQCLTKESNLKMYNGELRAIDKIRVGDILQAFDEETFEKRECEVEFVTSFVPKELYEVELENGEKFYATPDHLIVANGKFISIEDMLHDVSAHDMLEL